MANKFYVFRVPAFERHNPDRAGESLQWFRCSSSMMNSARFLELSNPAKVLWFWILGEVAKSRSREACETAAGLSRVVRRKTAGIPAVVRELIDLEWIQVVASPTNNTNERTNERTGKGRVKRRRSTASQPPAEGLCEQPSLPAVIEEVKVPIEPPEPKLPNPVTVYCDAYKARYGHSPTIGPKHAGILKRLGDAYRGKLPEIIHGYFAMPSTFLVERSHPVELIETKLNEVVRYLATGKVVTRAHTEQMNERLDEVMGPKPMGIAEIRAMRQKRIAGAGGDQ